MKIFVFSLLASLTSITQVLAHVHDFEPSLTDRARVLLEQEVDEVNAFISSHPILSQLTHFDLSEHDHEQRRMLNDMIQSDEIEYATEHAGEEYNLRLKRKKLHDEQGLPHYIYHPDEEIDADNNPFGRKLSESFSVEYHHVDCIYTGHLVSNPEQKAVFSFCNDEVRGVLDLPETKDQVHVQPIELSGRRMLASWKLSSIAEADRTCGNKSPEHSDSLVEERGGTSFSENFLTASSARPSDSRIDVFMVNDKARTDRYTIFGIFSQTLFVFSLVDILYGGFPGDDRIEIAPVGILSMAFRDAWAPLIPNPDEPSVQVNDGGLLARFGTFMNNVQNEIRDPLGGVVNFDIAHLLSGEDFVNSAGNQGVVGLANVGTVCGSASSATGTTQDLFIDANTATVVAHEIGHNLGFEHTDVPIGDGSTCNEASIRRIMDSSGTTAQSWSSCAAFWWTQTLNTGLNCILRSIGGFVPVNGPYCGNGIVEEGEECDCGANDCSIDGQISGQPLDPCCDGSTCRYLPTSDCAANDLCCDISTCSFADNTTVCRAKRDSSDCDTAEFCTGTSASCPEDVLAPFGSSCSVDGFGGNCYRGSCVSSGAQCNDVGLGTSCSNSGSGNAFCQAVSGSGIRCLGSQSSCVIGTSFPQISPADGTECDNGRGCYLGTCVPYDEIPVLDVCFNFEQDLGETDIDCGGDLCLPCTAGKNCLQSSDCFSLVCEVDPQSNVSASICIGDEAIFDEDIFDVIGRFLKDNPGVAALVYLSIIGFIGYFVYHDYKEKKKKKVRRKEIGSVRQETYRNSLRHSQMSSALRPLSVGRDRPASSGFSVVEIPELNISQGNRSSNRSDIPSEEVVSENPRYSGGRNRTAGRPRSNPSPKAEESLPPVAIVADLPEFNDEIEDKI